MGVPGAFPPNPSFRYKKLQLIRSHWDPLASVSQSAKALALIPKPQTPTRCFPGLGVKWRGWRYDVREETGLTAAHWALVNSPIRMMAAPGVLWEVVRLENFPIHRFVTGSTRECSRNYSHMLNRNRDFVKLTLKMKLRQTWNPIFLLSGFHSPQQSQFDIPPWWS